MTDFTQQQLESWVSMSATFDLSCVTAWREKLNQHPVYGSIHNLDDIRIFMSHHVYSVWDFMSLAKFLQHKIAPAQFPWIPIGHPSVRRFINEIVLEEESDEGLPSSDGKKSYCSHFELYCQAMQEIGAGTSKPLEFVALVQREGIHTALTRDIAPMPSRRFMEATFGFIDTDKSHVVAAAFALGREHVIPGMFRSLLNKMEVAENAAPAFHYYLRRHIHLDEGSHGPLSLLMLNELCAGDKHKLEEAEQAAIQAIEARLAFWDGVQAALG